MCMLYFCITERSFPLLMWYKATLGTLRHCKKTHILCITQKFCLKNRFCLRKDMPPIILVTNIVMKLFLPHSHALHSHLSKLIKKQIFVRKEAWSLISCEYNLTSNSLLYRPSVILQCHKDKLAHTSYLKSQKTNFGRK